MSGGWRWNAGRPGWKPKAEACFRVDLRTMNLLGSGTLTFRRGGEVIGGLAYKGTHDELVLDFMLNGTPMQQRVAISRTACNYGGSRSWLACPRCTRRCLVLYASRAGFNCRTCTRVAYTSQSEDAIGRSWRRQQKAEAKLGENWARPKGMHRRTRERLLEVIFEAEEVRELEILAYIARHLEAFDSRGTVSAAGEQRAGAAKQTIGGAER